MSISICAEFFLNGFTQLNPRQKWFDLEVIIWVFNLEDFWQILKLED